MWEQELYVLQCCPCMNLDSWVHGRHGANCCCSGCVGEHYEAGKCVQLHRTGLWECVPRIFALHRLTANQAEVPERAAQLEPWWCWAFWGCRKLGGGGELQQRKQSFRNHWQVYRGLVPADSAFSDLKWRESFLSLKSLLHPSVQRSKTMRHHSQADT